MYGFSAKHLDIHYPVTVDYLAKKLRVGPYKLRDYLREKGVWDFENDPTPAYRDGYFQLTVKELPNGKIHEYYLVTEKGDSLIRRMVANDGKFYVQNRKIGNSTNEVSDYQQLLW